MLGEQMCGCMHAAPACVCPYKFLYFLKDVLNCALSIDTIGQIQP